MKKKIITPGNHHSFDPSQLESFIYLYILVDFVELDAVCPLKSISNIQFLIIYITSSINMYYTHRYTILLCCEREWEKKISDDVDIHAR